LSKKIYAVVVLNVNAVNDSVVLKLKMMA